MLQFTVSHFFELMPAAVLLVLSTAILLVSVFLKSTNNRRVVYFLTQMSVLVTLCLVIHSLNFQDSVLFGDQQWVIDQLAVMSKLFILIVTFFVFVFARKEVAQLQLPCGEFYVLALFSLIGMLAMCSANSFLMLFLAIELTSLPLYALCAFNRKSALGAEAAMKYFITGAVATCLLLYGLSLLFGVTHSFQFFEVNDVLHHINPGQYWIVMTSLAFIIAGFGFKLGLVPFHMWVPDVYQGAPVSVVMLLGCAPKIAAITLFSRMLYQVFGDFHVQWSELLIILSILSMVFGNLLAIVQTTIRRLLGYSAIAHAGYMLLGLIAGNHFGVTAALFYVVSYAITAVGCFGILILLNRTGFEVTQISDLAGLNNRHPWLAFLMLLLLFSMAGIPPTLGFMAKFSVVLSLVHAHKVWLASLALVFAIIGIYYYLRVVKTIYFDSSKQSGLPLRIPRDMTIAISINGLAVLVLGIFPSIILGALNSPF
jgi:NADH-quinone oxidoreductase subunit N